MAEQASTKTLETGTVARLFGLITFLVTFAIYARTVFPSLPYGDSGELAAASYTLGISHPTGYPLFTLIGFVWSHLPIPGSVIYRLNILAALYVSGSVLVFYKTALMLVRVGASGGAVEEALSPWHVIVAAAGALGFGFAKTVWDQATGYEVYSLHLLLANALLFFTLRAVMVPATSRKSFLTAAFLLGLCFTNHLTIAFAVPGLTYLFFRNQGFGRDALRLFGLMLILVTLPLLFYLYLPLRSSSSFPFASMARPFLDNGLTGAGWQNFFGHLFGQGFRSKMSLNSLGLNLGKFATLLPSQLAYFGLIPVVFGVRHLYGKARAVLWFCTLLCFFSLGFALCYTIFDIDSYFLLTFNVLLILMVVGLGSLRPRMQWITYGSFLLPALSLATNYAVNDNSRDFTELEFISNWTRNAEPNAVIITNEWTVFISGMLYLQGVEGYRKDISIIPFQDWYSFPTSAERCMRTYPAVTSGARVELGEVTSEIRSRGKASNETVMRAVHAVVSSNLSKHPVYVGYDLYGLESNKDQMLVPVGTMAKVVPRHGRTPVIPSTFEVSQILSADTRRGDSDKRLVEKDLAYVLDTVVPYEQQTEQTEAATQHALLLTAIRAKVSGP